MLDGINPFTWIKAVRQIRKWSPDLLVLPAWTFFIAPALGWIAKRCGAETCMIVHNMTDHETASWKTRLSLWQLTQADRFVTHNMALAGQINEHFPDRHVDVFPHPVFDDFPAPTGRLPREAEMELLFFGLVRPYKGLDILVDAFAKADRSDARLTIVGEFWGGLDELKSQIAGFNGNGQIDLIPQFVSDADAAEYFERSDVVVLPYRSVTGSGVIPTAYHYGRAVIASDLPGLADVIRENETGWLVKPEDADDLAQLISSLKRPVADVAGAQARAFGKTLNWERFAKLVAP
jgi:glycosyltransferase involved in cell wall biosynthesis